MSKFSKLLAVVFTLSAVSPSWALRFERACDPAESTLTLGAVGDLLIHKYIQNAASQQKGRYSYLWSKISYRINSVDLMYANLETPLAHGVAKDGSLHDGTKIFWDEYIYSGFPNFNVHPVMAQNLKSGGFDIVSTANNHSMDRGKIGVDRTIDALEGAGLAFTGTKRRNEARSWSKVLQTRGWRVGFIACTYGLNGYSDPQDQVLECYKEKSTLLNEIYRLKSQVDVVVVTPHWGVENSHRPQSQDKNLAYEMIAYGADAVIGTHPHVIQPWESYKASNGREGLIVYSTGNFVSSQPGINKLGQMIFVGFSKDRRGAWVNGARYSPLWMARSFLPVDFLDRSSVGYWDTVSSVMQDREGLLRSDESLVTNPHCY